MVKVNKTKDYIERTFWTLAEFAIGAGLADKIVGDASSWWTPLFIGGVATLKILVAQHVGQHGSGGAIPGGTIETQP